MRARVHVGGRGGVRGCMGEGRVYVCGCTGTEYCVCVCTRKKRAEIKFVNVNASMLKECFVLGINN